VTAYLKGFRIDKHGNVVPKKTRKSVSQRIAEKKSTRQRAVSRYAAELHFKIGNGNGTKGSKGA
jgi:hypothetical protein